MTGEIVSRITLRSAAVALALFALAVLALSAESAQADPADFGIESVSATRSTNQAGGHPDLTTVVVIKTNPASPEEPDGDHEPYAATRDLSIALPPGMIGNPNAIATCTQLQFSTSLAPGGGCPIASQVGVTVLHLAGLPIPLTEPVYRLAAPGGDNVAQLGFWGYNVPVVVNVQLRSESDYGVTALGRGFPSTPILVSATTTLWGVPSSSAHDEERMTPKEVLDSGGLVTSSPSRPTGLAPLAFTLNPTSCGSPQEVEFGVDSYTEPGVFRTASAQMDPTTGCGLLEFNPDIALNPTSSQADSPSGIDVDLEIDQSNISAPGDLASAHLKKAVVTLPVGAALDPSSANGLEACSEDQVGLISESPIHFDRDASQCPDASKVGSVQIKTPVLDEPIDGSLYVARQNENPFHSLLAGYLVARGQGATIKLAGRFDLDPRTGQIVATFDENPQQPFSDMRLHFNGGENGVLVTPPQCGSYEVHTELVPWSGTAPVHRTSTFDVTSGPGGSPCPNPPAFAPGFEAGSATPLAGAYSPLVVKASRPDGSQTLTGMDVKLPEGLIGKLAGIPYCSDVALAAAAARSGRAEAAATSCPAESRLGSVDVGAGAGNSPLHVQGSAYLAGAYKGAPLSIAVVTPAVAGPFDLGTVVVRAAVQVNPVTAQVRAISDPFPTILQGVPLHLRSVVVNLDRERFGRNPTSCEPMRVEGTLIGTPDLKSLANRFQVGGCKGLDFSPKLSLRLKGGTKRGAHPALRAVLQAKDGEANIKRVSVALPHAEFLAQEHIDTICTRVQFAADECPKGSIYGYAKAWTPLLDRPLQGPVYLRSSSHKLPDLVAALHGQIDIELSGRIDSHEGGIRTTFSSVPDAPVSKFILSMKGGRKSLLVNSEDTCRSTARAVVKMDAHNGDFHDFRARLRRSCGGKGH